MALARMERFFGMGPDIGDFDAGVADWAAGGGGGGIAGLRDT